MKSQFKILLFVIIISLYSCNNNDDDNSNSELISSWKLIENLVDPGGGNGTFQAVESHKIIKFYTDGTITSNGSLCDMSINSDNSSSGTYSSSNLTFNSSDCTNTELDYSYQIDGSFLTVNYPCFEPCISKYSLIE